MSYPSGMPSRRYCHIEYHCSCGACWEADAIEDLGMCDLVHEDDEICPTCGELGRC